jgi:N-acetylneuraminic acid mutarotase
MKNNTLLFAIFAALTLTTQVARSQCEGDAWAAKASLLKGGIGIATCTVNGKLYAFGAGWGVDNTLNTVQEYDPVTDSWTYRTNMPTARAWATASAVNGKCYVMGGATVFRTAVTTVEEYDPATDSWRDRTPLPEQRQAASSVAVDGKIYVMGGSDIASFSPNDVLSTVVIYDPATNQWSTGADMPTPRYGMAIEAIDGLIYTIGGSSPPDGLQFSNIVERFNPATNQWGTRASLPESVGWPTASVYNGILYVMGGFVSFTGGGITSAAVHGYISNSDQWVRQANMSRARWGLSSETLGARIVAIGGRTLTESRGLDLTEEYTPCNIDNVPPFNINPGLNDAWFNLATAGQGFLITVFPDRKEVFLAWFTYDTERPPEDVTAFLGEPGHRWLTAQGPYDGDTANLTIFVTEGGIFDAAEPATDTDPAGDGTMTIEFADCTEGLVRYEITSLDISGEIPIQRITPDNVALCEALASP